MKRSLIALAAFALLSTVGCKKEDANAALSVSKENVAGTYKISSVKAQANGAAEVDITSDFMDPCATDDLITLKTDLTFTVVDAGTKCDPPGDYISDWSLTGSTLSLDGETFTVKSVTKAQLVLTNSGDLNGVSATITMTLNKQ